MVETAQTSEDYLLLKWGTLKGWQFASEQSRRLMQRYIELGSSMSAMAQRDTPEQKEIIYELIRQHEGEIINDWSGEKLTKEQAIKYVRDYGR